MSKRVGIGLKPGAQKTADDWVGEPRQPVEVVQKKSSEPAPGSIKRLTIDISEDLHRALKVKAASEGVRMADLVRNWIEEGCASP